MGLVEVLVALGLTGIIALALMHFSKQGMEIQRSAATGLDELEMIQLMRNILSKPQNCHEALKTGLARGPIKFYKKDIDEPLEDEGIETEFYRKAYDGSLKKMFSSVGDESKYRQIEITSIKLVMNNGEGFNYPANEKINDTGVFHIRYKKPQGSSWVSKIYNLNINVVAETDASGQTTALGCGVEGSSGVKRTRATRTNLTSTGNINNYDETINFICPGDKVLCGERSVHSNGAEDRIVIFAMREKS